MALRGALVLAGILRAAAQQNICGLNSTIGNAVVASLNLTYPGLEAVAAAVGAGDLNLACEEIASYYANSNTSYWYRGPTPKPGNGLAGGVADDLVFRDKFYLAGVNISWVIPRNVDGGLQWTYKGPRNDVEFMNCLNRHDSMAELLAAWQSTGNDIYVNYFNSLVLDWVLHNPCPNATAHSAHTQQCVPYGAMGTFSQPTCSWVAQTSSDAQACYTSTFESPWRSLEMGIRLDGAWPPVFFGFQGAARTEGANGSFTTSARVAMLLAVSEHMQALAVDGGHPGQGTPNWEMTQWQGLVTACVAWPELYNASALLTLAVTELAALLNSGVYPDGVETEQASGYDMGTASDFFNTVNLLRLANSTGTSHATVPPGFAEHVEAMWNYGSYVSDPLGCLPRNGDSDVCGNGYDAGKVAFFNRSDWAYVHTNGAQGSPPPFVAAQGPAVIFPWAGQTVLRSDYGVNATWVWFDTGPYGSSGHAHCDKLNLHVHARGSMLLTDSGRFAYAGGDLSNTLHNEYAQTTHAHNTMRIEGAEQLPLPAVATAPVDSDSYSFSPLVDTVHGTMSYYSNLVGSANHSRAIYYQRARPAIPAPPVGSQDGDWLVVLDILDSDRQRAVVEVTWHTHPNSSVAVDQSTGVATVGGATWVTDEPTSAQACVIPALSSSITTGWDSIAIIRGQYRDDKAGHEWQGWYSPSYDGAFPASTLVYQAHNISQHHFSADSGMTGGTTTAPARVYFAWLIIPTGQPTPCTGTVQITAVGQGSVQVDVQPSAGGEKVSITVPVPALPASPSAAA